MPTLTQRVAELREAYRRVASTLPWLDATVWPEERPAFPEHAQPLATPHVAAAALEPQMTGRVRDFCTGHRVQLLRYSPALAGPLREQRGLLDELAQASIPLVVLHTDVSPAEVEALAQDHPHLPIIVESGPLKIMYQLEELRELLLRRGNVYLCTYNLCNWMALERLCDAGLAPRLIYGSHHPVYNPAAAMGPIVMGRLSWKHKCAIAGNNLRRLLGLEPLTPAEQPFAPPPPFIIDAHAHNTGHGAPTPYRFATPDQRMRPDDWLAFMSSVSVERMILMPAAALVHGTETAAEGSLALRRAAPERFRYLEIFQPGQNDAYREAVAASLRESSCVGLKIHPTIHETPAEDPAYEPAYLLAAAAGKPILTHSWEASATNPQQVLSHPDRFRPHLERHPRTALVLGHAGGRPSTMESVVRLCRDFANLHVDISGDYFHNGLLETLAARLSADRVLFGSDANWIDPRCTLAPALCSALDDAEVGRVLCANALRVYALA